MELSMATAKKTITEDKAAAFFHSSVIEAINGRWPEIKRIFRRLIRDESFSFANEEGALFDLLLAVEASELGALKNVFPADQAHRLFDLCLGSWESPEDIEYARVEIEEYGNYYEKALKEGENPIFAIPVRLLHRWLGSAIRNFLVKLKGTRALALGVPEGGYIDPMLVQVFTQEVFFGIIGFGRWKRISDEYRLIPEAN
jgi:hypothetical protein